jgi:vitamin B12 transporter
MKLAAVSLLFLAAVASGAQQQPPTVLRGSVVASTGPVIGANVFLIETLEGALTDSSGHFSFRSEHSGRALLMIKATGFDDVRRTIELPVLEPISILLKKDTHKLAPTTVVASRYAASDDRGATLTTLDVVSTPGTNADVMRAIQTLPGVQNVDEGTGIYVRGGDYTETHVLLNDAVLHTAFTFESPTGTFIGTVDPFLLDGIYFSSGGFGAKYGNVLSGLAALNTLGRPKKTGYAGGAGLAALSATGSVALSKELGVRFAANQFDTDLLFKVNGSVQEYAKPPRGYDRSGSVIWNYRPSGELKTFVIRQTTDLITTVDEPSYSGAYSLGVASHLGVVNWRDVFGQWSPSLRVSDTKMRRTQDYGAFRMLTGEHYRGAQGQVDWSPAGGLTLRAGGDFERNWSELDGSVPEQGDDKKPGARSTLVGSFTQGDRTSAFVELDVLAGARTRLVAGLRSDNSALAAASTLDPRLSAAITVVPGVVLTGAWGVYHQVPDPLFFDSTLGIPGLPSMRATHTIIGIQAGSMGQMIRLELFDKQYRDLAQVTRDFDVDSGGVGSARGADLFVSGSGFPGMKWRVSLSSIVSKRTDPNTGLLVRAPFDVSTSVTTVVNHAITPAWHLGFSQRYATGRPFTPVTSATFDATRNVWDPQYGAPMSERLPAFRRIDLGVTHLRRIATKTVVMYSSVSNVFDRDNIYMYRYSQDYTLRIPIRSMFKRSYYVGFSVTQ